MRISPRSSRRHLSLVTVILFCLVYFVSPYLQSFLVRGATLSSAKNTIGDSRSGVATSHTFAFTTPSTTSIKTITFQYCTTASGSCTAPTGMVLSGSPTFGTVTGIAGTTYTPTSTSANCTGTGNSDCTLTLTVTTPSAQSGNDAVVVPFATGVTNPTTTNTSFFVRIATKDGSAVTIDSTTVAFATLTDTSIAVTAAVDPTFTFSVAAANTGTVNGATINVTTSTANAIPFGTLSAGSTKIAAHDVTVTTNAAGGYTVTAKALANPPLADGLNNIDYFTGTNASPASWTSPAGSTPSVNTGFVGYTTADSTLSGGSPARFSSNKWAGMTTTADEVVYSATGVNSEVTRVGWQAEVNGLQAAGSYSGTFILVATPTY